MLAVVTIVCDVVLVGIGWRLIARHRQGSASRRAAMPLVTPGHESTSVQRGDVTAGVTAPVNEAAGVTEPGNEAAGVTEPDNEAATGGAAIGPGLAEYGDLTPVGFRRLRRPAPVPAAAGDAAPLDRTSAEDAAGEAVEDVGL